MAYLTVFLSALVAATLLPMQSEALLAYHLTDPFLSIGLLLGVATLGNVLGSTVNWACGRFLRRFQGRRWLPVSPAALARVEGRYYRYERISIIVKGIHWRTYERLCREHDALSDRALVGIMDHLNLLSGRF